MRFLKKGGCFLQLALVHLHVIAVYTVMGRILFLDLRDKTPVRQDFFASSVTTSMPSNCLIEASSFNLVMLTLVSEDSKFSYP